MTTVAYYILPQITVRSIEGRMICCALVHLCSRKYANAGRLRKRYLPELLLEDDRVKSLLVLLRVTSVGLPAMFK